MSVKLLSFYCLVAVLLFNLMGERLVYSQITPPHSRPVQLKEVDFADLSDDSAGFRFNHVATDGVIATQDKFFLVDWPAPFAAESTGLPLMIDPSLVDEMGKVRVPQDVKKNAVREIKPAAAVKQVVKQIENRLPFSEVIIELKPNQKELTEEMVKRKERIETCLKFHYTKPVNADLLRPWSLMHGVLAYGQNSLVASRGHRISGVDYLCHNGIGNDRRLLSLANGRLSVAVGPGSQGHEGQLLAILAQVQTPLDHPIEVNGKSLTVKDLVEYEKQSCRPNTELTFKLIGLSVYLGSEEVWKDSTGRSWDISRLMYEEMAQPINGAACGGTHRLMGLSYALAMRKVRGEPIDGQWKRAENFLAGYQQQALALQTSDGGFSTEFFEGLSHSPDSIRQIYSTGHCLEWLSISMSDEQLASSAVSKMVDRLLDLMELEYRKEQELQGTDVGPKSHALRALRLYELRVFGQPSDHQELAAKDPRPILSAQEIAIAQQKQRVVIPTGFDVTNVTTGSSATSATPSNLPNSRSNRFMRRR